MDVKFKLNNYELRIKKMLMAVKSSCYNRTPGGLRQGLKKFQSENLRNYINLRIILVKFLLQAQDIVLFLLTRRFKFVYISFHLSDRNFNSCL